MTVNISIVDDNRPMLELLKMMFAVVFGYIVAEKMPLTVIAYISRLN